MLVPGTTAEGDVIQASSFASVQVMPALFSAEEYAKPGYVAALRPTIPNKFGPILLGATLALAWQMAQRSKTLDPFAALPPASADVASKTPRSAASAVVDDFIPDPLRLLRPIIPESPALQAAA